MICLMLPNEVLSDVDLLGFITLFSLAHIYFLMEEIWIATVMVAVAKQASLVYPSRWLKTFGEHLIQLPK